MSLTPAALRKLQEFGLTLDQVIELAELLPEKVTSKGAERQRRYRERKGANVTSDVTRYASPGDAPAPVPLSPTPPNPSNPTPFTPLKGGVSPSPAVSDDVKTALAEWNDLAKRLGLPEAKRLDKTRTAAIRAKLDEGGLTIWREALAAVEKSRFCRGDNDRGFRADLDFVCQPKSWRRLLEGFYAPKSAVATRPSAAATGPPSEPEQRRRERHYRETGEWKDHWGENPLAGRAA